jgi:hypothetical protein
VLEDAVNLDVNVLVDTFNTAIREEPKLPQPLADPRARRGRAVANAIDDPVA